MKCLLIWAGELDGSNDHQITGPRLLWVSELLEGPGLPSHSYRQHPLTGQAKWDKWATLRSRMAHASHCKAQGRVQSRKEQDDTLEYLANGETELCNSTMGKVLFISSEGGKPQAYCGIYCPLPGQKNKKNKIMASNTAIKNQISLCC